MDKKLARPDLPPGKKTVLSWYLHQSVTSTRSSTKSVTTSSTRYSIRLQQGVSTRVYEFWTSRPNDWTPCAHGSDKNTMRQYKSPNNNFYTIVFDIAELKFLGTFRKECYSCRSTLASCWIIVTIKEVVSGGGHHGCSDQRRLGLHRHPPSWAGPCTAPCSPSCTAHNLY